MLHEQAYLAAFARPRAAASVGFALEPDALHAALEADFNSAKITMSARQAAAASADPSGSLGAAFRGQVIDKAAKLAVGNDPGLPSIYVTRPGEFGPDFLDLNSVPGAPQWWDITTLGQCWQHLDDYAGFGNGTPLFTR